MLLNYTSAAFTNSSGLAVAAGATVEVRREDTGALASIYSNVDGTIPITNPSAFADSNGRFVFYVAALRQGYRVRVTSGSLDYTARYQLQANAANVVFTPAGAGAFTRDVEAKLQDIVSIKDYGAIADDLTNVSSAWTAALGAIPTDGCGIYWPAGKYYLDNPGAGSTIFRIESKKNVAVYSHGAKIRFSKNTRFLIASLLENLEVSGFHFVGTLQRDAYTANEEQTRIRVHDSTFVEIQDNMWEDSPQCVFFAGNIEVLNIHHNRVKLGFAPFQGGGGAGIFHRRYLICDNIIQANNTPVNPPDYSANDDAIAVFAGPTDSISICRNIIDKAGVVGSPNNNNIAHGILVQCITSSSVTNVEVNDNIITNNINTSSLGIYQRAAIEVSALNSDASASVANATIRGNVIYNCCAGIFCTGKVERLSITLNVIDKIVAGASGALPPIGIYTEGAPNTTTNFMDVSHNVVTNTAAQGIVTLGDHYSCDSNIVRNAGNNGIEARQQTIGSPPASGGISVSNNNINTTAAGTNGIAIHDLVDANVNNNTITRAGAYGILASNIFGDMKRVNLIGNQIVGSGLGKYNIGSIPAANFNFGPGMDEGNVQVTASLRAAGSDMDGRYQIEAVTGGSAEYPYRLWIYASGARLRLDQIAKVATASLPAASAVLDGHLIVEDAGGSPNAMNLIAYHGGKRFRIPMTEF